MRTRGGTPIALGLVLLGGCASETLRSSTLTAPARVGTTQETGMVSFEDGSGAVRVIAPVPGGATPWRQVKPLGKPTPRTALLGDISQFRGDATYTLTASVVIPHDAGVVTLQFEPSGHGQKLYGNFLHLDFLPDNTVRVDDKNDVVFGAFPRDQIFVVIVTLNMTGSSTKAHFGLLGAGASGSLDYTVDPALQKVALQFGAVRFWTGSRHTGSPAADHVLAAHAR
jgi:hypothetical protein